MADSTERAHHAASRPKFTRAEIRRRYKLRHRDRINARRRIRAREKYAALSVEQKAAIAARAKARYVSAVSVERSRRWRLANPERAAEAKKRWAVLNKEKVKESRRKSRNKFRAERAEYDRRWRNLNRQRLRDRATALRRKRGIKARPFDCRSLSTDDKRERALALKRIAGKRYYDKHKRRLNDKKMQRWRADGMARSCHVLRKRTQMAIRRFANGVKVKTNKLLGADWSVVAEHISSRFTEGMSWANYGKWHIDHIIPLASAVTVDELIRLCHFTNLQPLWAPDNLRKGSRL